MSGREYDRIDFMMATVYYLSTGTHPTYYNGFRRSQDHMN